MAKSKPIENAEEVIERFGGIRPMASKLESPVTTVQGWKKRGSIPGTRREDIKKAAKDHNIKIDDLMGDGDTQTSGSADTKKPSVYKEDGPAITDSKTTKSGGISGFGMIVLILFILAIIGAIAVLATGRGNFNLSSPLVPFALESNAIIEAQNERIQELEDKLAETETASSSFSSRLQNQVQNLQQKTGNLQRGLNTLQEKAPQLPQGVQTKLTDLENQISTLIQQNGTNGLGAYLVRLQNLVQIPDGQDQLQVTARDMLDWLQQYEDEGVTVDTLLPAIRLESDAAAKTFEGVQNDDLKAAALLLTMTQIRSTLARDRASFETDLALLQRLVGNENPALQASLEKLSPHAQSGVLTPDGLNQEFRGLTGEIVSASLTGGDVNLQERATARFNAILSIQKDGELITGTQTQQLVNQAQQHLDNGDIGAAIEILQELDGDAAKQAEPFIQEAELTLLAGQVQGLITQSIESKIRVNALSKASQIGNAPGLAIEGLKSALPLQGQVIEDPESGFKIYKPSALEKVLP